MSPRYRLGIDAVLVLNGHQHERLVAQPSCGVEGPASLWRYVLLGRSNLCGCNGPLRGRTSALIQVHLSWLATAFGHHFRPFRCVHRYRCPGLNGQRKSEDGNRSRGQRAERRGDSRH